MTRPTKVLGAKDKLAKKATNAQEDGEEEDEEGKHDQAAVDVGDSRMSAPAPATSPVPIGAAAKTQKIAITPSSSSTSSVSAGKPEGLARLKAGAATSGKPPQRPPTDSTGLVALKRSVSPATSHSSSKEGHLLSIGSVFHDDAADSNSSGGMYSPPPRSASSDINVRGSLTLLKTKAASSRRRRSVADIEGAQTRDAGGATAATGGGTDGEDTGAPNYSSRLNRNNYSASVAGDEPQAAFYNRNPAHVSLDLTNYAISDGDNAGEDTTEKAGEEEPTFEQTDEFDGGGGVASRPTMECPTCSRMFNPLPFEKHVKVCAKVFVGKRKTFDSAKMRIEGNPDLKSFVEEESKSSGGRGGGAGKKGKPTLERKTSSGKEMSGAAATPTTTTAGANSKWKEQSDAFRAAMKSARDVSIAIATGAPLPPPTVSAPDSSLVQCPHCQRRFNASAAERHIPVCQNIRAKPASLKRGGGGNASNGSTTGVSSAVKGRNWQ